MFRQRHEKGNRFLKVKVAVEVLLIEFTHHKLFEFGTGDVRMGQRQENAAEGWSLSASEGLDPLNSDGGDDGVEVVVDGELVVADVAEERCDMVVGEEFEVFLGEREVP